ncbi:MAG TPA: M17 family peptidase N-terminal domain-containing protein, partial [Candidatus Syntrophosphaera sp.]|nr:M17 family peptidase N-terminal domain-containing protein [Candidatus Syntrophosphaera sp.]
MKIDLLRKPTDHMDTVIVMHGEKGDIHSVEYLPEFVISAASVIIKQEDFSFEYASVKSFPIVHNRYRSNIILCGVGNPHELDCDKLRHLIALCVRAALKLNAKELFLFPGFNNPVGEVNFGHILAEAALLTEYKFDKYLSDSKQATIESFHLAINPKTARHINRGILEG